MNKNKFLPFDVNHVPLQGKSLVEASAGTGKTFSIGILVLRLVLEKNISIEKILLVTFTNNAVAELEERIRLFVRSAHDYAVRGAMVETHIATVVDQARQQAGEEAVLQGLKDAVLFLDQLSVMTIHGFCRQTLSDQAFETGQLFDSELLTNLDEIHEKFVMDFWRRHVNTLPFPIFKLLREHDLTVESLKKLVGNYFANKPFFLFDPSKQYKPLAEGRDKECEQLLKNLEVHLTEFASCLEAQKQNLKAVMLANPYAKNHIADLDSPAAILGVLREKSDRDYVQKIFGTTLLPHYEAFRKCEEELEQLATGLMNDIYCFALQEIPARITKHMQTAGIVSFDGLIRNLHDALQGPNQQNIVSGLQRSYDAVFVDEFQDTDRLQYEIFKTAFHTNTILFYIGDPKQSIYAFRQADIKTYLAAYGDVDARYSMNRNFRSTPRLIGALNKFFLPYENFDTFSFEGQPQSIRYVKVDAANTGSAKDFYFDKDKHAVLSIEKCGKSDEVLESTANRIVELLTNPRYYLHDGKQKRTIQPSDIGVLVSTNSFGKRLKNLLSKKNVPAVILNDDKIMKSAEAFALYHVMKAMHNPNVENINTALLNQFTGLSSDEVIMLDKEQLMEMFRGYKAQWEAKSINQALSAYIADLRVREHLIDLNTENGLRIISNLLQLKELLTKTEYQQRLNPDELLDWMKRAKDLELLSEDEGVIRLESDEDSVLITTVHKAKGLEYNIVFSIESDFPLRERKMVDWPELNLDAGTITVPNNQMQEAQWEIFESQSRQEKRRLLYVALTRAIYACFIYHSKQKKKDSTLNDFLEAIQADDSIRLLEFDADAVTGSKYRPQHSKSAKPARLKHKFEPAGRNWQYMSYSQLAADQRVLIEFPSEEADADYDRFVFDKLKRGNITGTMLHEIFENIDFVTGENHAYQINRSVLRYAPSQIAAYGRFLPELILEVLSATVDTGSDSFTLGQIPAGSRLHELEFDFSVARLDTSRFAAICDHFGIIATMNHRPQLQGIMNGFIDMLFLHNGRYYLLDWKSNFLGADLGQYRDEALETAMTLNNYHLQYLIYTVAAVKYLNQRLPDFNYDRDFGGVIYCFIRGMRQGSDTGVFFRKPGRNLICQLEELLTDRVTLQA